MTSEEISSGKGEVEATADAQPSEPSEAKESAEACTQAQEEQPTASQAGGPPGGPEQPSAKQGERVHEAKDRELPESRPNDAEETTDEGQAASTSTILPTRSSRQLQVPEWRKSSTVSFKDVAELFEIDLEANKRPERPPALLSLRFYIMVLALFSPFVVTYSKTIIYFAITDMIEPTYLVQTSATQEQTTRPFPASNTTSTQAMSAREPLYYFEVDNSCSVDGPTRERLLDELNKQQEQKRGGESVRFQWDTVKQGLLKSAYSLGHMLLQVAGGRLSEIYGSHPIMGSCAALIGFSCLAAPFLASAHFYLLFADLFVLGILGSFMTPALITLFANWLTPNEKSIMLSFYLVSSRLGYALSSLLCGLLIDAKLPWSYLFYSAGWVALAFSLLFFICARSRPHQHPLIRAPELDYLASKNSVVREAIAKSKRQAHGLPEEKPSALKMDRIKSESAGSEVKPEMEVDKTDASGREGEGEGGEKKKKKGAKRAPWGAILTNRAVWAFMMTKFCVKLAGDTVQTELPVYLKRVMHLSGRHNGFINASNYVIFCLSCLLVGWLARLANKRLPFGWTKTSVRKLFQCTASCGVGLSLLGITYFACNEKGTVAMLMALFFFTTFGTGGEAQIPLDISERYSGTIHALGSQLAISGAIEPTLVGYILRDSAADRDRWTAVWVGASAVAFLGGLVFALFGDATIQPFDKIDLDCEAKSERAKEEDEPPKRTSVELKGHINGSFQMKEERAESEKAHHPQRTAPQSAEI